MKNAIVATMEHRDSKRAARIADIARSIADEPAAILRGIRALSRAKNLELVGPF